MNKQILIVMGVIVLVALLLVFSPRLFGDKESSLALDGFAACLAEKRVTMYGAVWCSHCKEQKKMFGDAFRLVPYVECPDNPQVCLDAGVKGYPTWIFPDGKKLEGTQKLETLSEVSGCPLPQASI